MGSDVKVKDWSTEKIVAVSLASSFVLVVIAADIVSVYNGSMEITAFGKEIAIGLFGYIGRGGVQAIDKRQAELQAQTNLNEKK